MTDKSESRLSDEQKTQIRKFAVWTGATGLLGAIVTAVLYLSWQTAGPIATVAYTVLFVFGATLLPGLILFGAPSFPGWMRSFMGKLHFILGQVTFGVGYLVQRQDRWEMCPGTRDKVFVDDQWHDIEDGQSNLSILGWKPFGIIRHKDLETMKDVRADFDTPRGVADGGASIQRGGYQELPLDASRYDEDSMIVDLKRVYSRGIRKMADIDTIEKAEEIQMRKEASSGGVGSWGGPVVGSIVGLVIGIATGYVMIGGV